MMPWVIAALVMICLVLLASCACLMWLLHEQREDIDLLTRNLIDVLNQRTDVRKLTRINGSGGARRI